MIEMSESVKKIVFVEISPGGWTYHYAPESSNKLKNDKLEGEGEPDFSLITEGAIIVDNREAVLRRDFAKNMMDSPLVSFNVKDNEVDEWRPSNSVIAASLAGELGLILKSHMAMKASGVCPGPLDFVSPYDYAKWWQKRGGRLGVAIDGKVVWEENEFSA